MFDNIPDEMKEYSQWVVWKAVPVTSGSGESKLTKVPYSAKGWKASVTKPTDWSSFADVCAVAHMYSGIGFVLSERDPFCIIDIDKTEDQDLVARQMQIHSAFATYSERSPSGAGLHIITRGSIPLGRRKHKVEMYSTVRFMTMTGNVFNDAPVAERPELILQLWDELKPDVSANTTIYHGTDELAFTDEEVISRALSAENGQKARNLATGNYIQHYASQSEADFALINIIAFYTDNQDQVMRLFRHSALGKRDKAQRDKYVRDMVDRSFDRKVPPVDLAQLEIEMSKVIATPVPVAEVIPDANAALLRQAADNKKIEWPPGITGEIAQYIYASSPRPVKEISIFAALGLMAGICGRAYNVSGTGLNQYMMLVARTGRGKDAIKGGISRMFDAIALTAPTAHEMRGPSSIASGQAIIKMLSRRNHHCVMSVIGEVGGLIGRMSSPRATSNDRQLKDTILDLFGRSGEGQVYDGMAYADTDKNVDPILSPSFTIVGESAPENLYADMDEGALESGLLPRFLIMHYDGIRPPLHEGASSVQVPQSLVDSFTTLAANACSLNAANTAIKVVIGEEAAPIMRGFDVYVDDLINKADSNSVIEELWNRAHLKALKLAAVLAVGSHPYNPVINKEHANWAIKLITREARALIAKFQRGEVGDHASEQIQQREVIKLIGKYLRGEITVEGVNKLVLQARIIPHALFGRLSRVRAFKEDRQGPSAAVRRVVNILIDSGYIEEIPSIQLNKSFNYRGKGYAPQNAKMADPTYTKGL